MKDKEKTKKDLFQLLIMLLIFISIVSYTIIKYI